MPFGQQSQFGLGSMIGDMRKEDLQSPLYGAAQEVPSAQLQMPEFGSQLRQEAPMPSLGGAESATSGASMGQVGAAGIHRSADLKMSDLVFSLEAAKQGKRIMHLAHNKGFIKYQDIPVHQTIHGQLVNKCDRQGELADEIYRLRRCT